MPALLRFSIRVLGALTLFAGLLPHEASASYHPFPIQVLTCQTDPGRYNPASGRGVPYDEFRSDHGCTFAPTISLTVLDSTGHYQRCETNAQGICLVDMSASSTVAAEVHWSTAPPGYTLGSSPTSAQFVMEFSGIGITLVPDGRVGASARDHRTLAFKLIGSHGPETTRANLSDAEVNSRGQPWLQTNADGWVSWPIDEANAGDQVDLMIDGQPSADMTCSVNGVGTAVPAERFNGKEGVFTRITIASGNGDITCTVATHR